MTKTMMVLVAAIVMSACTPGLDCNSQDNCGGLASALQESCTAKVKSALATDASEEEIAKALSEATPSGCVYEVVAEEKQIQEHVRACACGVTLSSVKL